MKSTPKPNGAQVVFAADPIENSDRVAKPKHIGSTGTAAENQRFEIPTLGAFKALLDSQTEQLAELLNGSARSKWTDTNGIAARYSVSRATICRWRQEGMPHVARGTIFLHDVEACDAWLSAQQMPKAVGT